MTPQQFAKAECPNCLSDGHCQALQAQEPQDYSLAVPDWMPVETWQALVIEARQEKKPTITVYRDENDRISRTGKRLDLHYCFRDDKKGNVRGCDTRMGIPERLCLRCLGINPSEQINTICLVERGLRCKHFENTILPIADQPDPDGQTGLARKRQEARDAYNGEHNIHRVVVYACPDCGRERQKGHHRCPVCALKQRRERQRGRRTSKFVAG